jgi:peptide/nickel transport system permease protein
VSPIHASGWSEAMTAEATATPARTVIRPSESASRRALRRFVHHRGALAGIIILMLITAAVLLLPLVYTVDPNATDLKQRFTPPGPDYPLGADRIGRDLLARLLAAGRVSLSVGFTAALLATGVGMLMGLIAGAFGGWVDALIMRIVDLQLSFPSILIALILLALLGQGVDKIVVALITVQWAYYARTVRGSALVERRKEYVDAAVCLAFSARRIVFRHILPNCLPPLIVVATVQVAHAIALEATLSFLGLGMPITSPSLGLLISNGFTHLLSGKYWMSFFPGIALLVTIVAINLVGDQLRDVLNPRLK